MQSALALSTSDLPSRGTPAHLCPQHLLKAGACHVKEISTSQATSEANERQTMTGNMYYYVRAEAQASQLSCCVAGQVKEGAQEMSAEGDTI